MERWTSNRLKKPLEPDNRQHLVVHTNMGCPFLWEGNLTQCFQREHC